MVIDDIYTLRTLMGEFSLDKESFEKCITLQEQAKEKDVWIPTKLSSPEGGEVYILIGKDTVLLHSTKEVRDKSRKWHEAWEQENSPSVSGVLGLPQSRGRNVQ